MREGSVNMKNKKHTILIVALVLSLTLNLLLLALHPIGTQKKSITGTFSSAGGKGVGGEIYLAVEADGDYTLYRQFQVLKTGSCRVERDVVYSDAQPMGYFDQKDTVVLLLDDTAYSLTRTDSIPVYVNVPGKMN